MLPVGAAAPWRAADPQRRVPRACGPRRGVSALGHLLGESATVDPSRGVFLDQTWRMHPDICAFTTEQFYEGRLRPEPGLRRQTVVGTGPLAGHGLRFIPVAHSGNTNASAEEAECVAGLIRELIGTAAAWVDRQGVQRRLTLDDVLVVAPYNAHLAVLRATLPAGARVATVDKFQGQEGPIVIYSMATSTADEAPRGWSSSTACTASTSPPRAPAAWPRSSPARPCSRRIAAPRSRCAWPTPLPLPRTRHARAPTRGPKLTSAPLSDPEPSLRRDRRTGRSLRAPRPRHRARWQGGDASGQIRRPERPRLAAASARRVACHPRPGLARPASPDGGFAPPTQESSALSIDCGRALVSRRGGRSRRIGRCCPFERGSGWKLECEL